MVGVFEYVVLASLIYLLGMVGVIYNRNNLIFVLMSIEVLFMGIFLMLIAFGAHHNDLQSIVFAILLLTVAAAEAAIALAIFILYFRRYKAVDLEQTPQETAEIL